MTLPVPAPSAEPPSAPTSPRCPVCGGPMWDNRSRKHNAKAPDFRCKTASCQGVIWPHRASRTPSIGPTPVAAIVPQVAAAIASRQASDNDAPADPTVTLYRDCAIAVLKRVRPLAVQAGVTLGDQALAAMIATLFIARHNRQTSAQPVGRVH